MGNQILLAGAQPELAAELVLLELGSHEAKITCTVRGSTPGAARAANTARVLARLPPSSRREAFGRINYAELRDIPADARCDRVWWLPGGLGGPLRQRHRRADRADLDVLTALRDVSVITVLPFGVPDELVYSGARSAGVVRIPHLADSAGGEWRHLLDAAVGVRADLARRGFTATAGSVATLADARDIARILFSATIGTWTVRPSGATAEIPALVAQRLDALKLFAEKDSVGDVKSCAGIDEAAMRTFAKDREAQYRAGRDGLHTEARIAARSAERITTRPGGPTHRALGAGTTPIVIVNALGQGEGYWWPLIATLAPRHRVLLCQQDTTGGLADQLADLTALLAAEHVRQCHLVGWCTGAKLVTRLAREQPARVLSLTMLAADFRYDGRDPELDGRYERNLAAVCRALLDRPALADRLVTLFTTTDDQPGQSSADAVLARPDPELAREIRRPFASGTALLAYARQLVEFWAHDELRPTGEIPTLFLIGDRDEIVAPAAERAAAANFPGALHGEFALGSHYLMYEQPQLVADVIADFLCDPATCADRAGGLSWH